MNENSDSVHQDGAQYHRLPSVLGGGFYDPINNNHIYGPGDAPKSITPQVSQAPSRYAPTLPSNNSGSNQNYGFRRYPERAPISAVKRQIYGLMGAAVGIVLGAFSELNYAWIIAAVAGIVSAYIAARRGIAGYFLRLMFFCATVSMAHFLTTFNSYRNAETHANERGLLHNVVGIIALPYDGLIHSTSKIIGYARTALASREIVQPSTKNNSGALPRDKLSETSKSK